MIPAKKAAKKTAKHAHSEDHSPKDLRRAYEHLGRVQILTEFAGIGGAREVGTLLDLAQQQLAAGRRKEAADLLRCAEHLSFAALNSSKTDPTVDEALRDVISNEFTHLIDKADEHWTRDHTRLAGTAEIYKSTVTRAHTAFDSSAFRKALELARGAEALAHVAHHEVKELKTAESVLQLKA